MRAVAKANLAFWPLWLLALLWCRQSSFDDPSSIFYNKEVAYTQRYSKFRSSQTDAFLNDTDRIAALQAPDLHDEILCVGIPSIQRNSEQSLSRALGSLVDTLTPAERSTIHIAVLLADRQATSHFAYGQSWLTHIADEVLVYEHEGAAAGYPPGYRSVPYNLREKGEIRGEGRMENMRLDQSVLVETCRQRGAPYFALIEDDIITSSDWYRKLLEGVAHLHQDYEDTESGRKDWMFLRLFQSDLSLESNAGDWVNYAEAVFLVYLTLILGFLCLRRRRQKRGSSSGYSLLAGKEQATPSNHAGNWQSLCLPVILTAGLWLPAVMVLMLLGGRSTTNGLNPLLNAHNGIREMPQHGCCGQGLVIPHRHMGDFQSLLRSPPFDLASDQILESHADHRGLLKWALQPSVVQHIGVKQSSDGQRSEEAWSFSFERRPVTPKQKRETLMLSV